MTSAYRMLAPRPFRADQIREGDPYELSNGHTILRLPMGRLGGRSRLAAGSVLETDPAVKSAGVDVGYSEKPSHLRAPDVSVGNVPDEPGWATEAPQLAVEYAVRGQDEAELQIKIQELFHGGTGFVWVVRLTGPRRVEVHLPGKAMRLARSGENLLALGILQNPVPVDALFDRDAAHEATLRNLLQRQGYASLDAIRAEGAQKGKLEGKLEGELRGRIGALLAVLAARGLPVEDAQRREIEAARDKRRLDAWIAKAAVVGSTVEVLAKKTRAARKPSRRREG